jgi:hypothetical protein
MNIRSIKLVNKGLKGAILEYDDSKSVNDLTFVNGFKERHKAPVPGVLKDEMGRLRYFLLSICGYLEDGMEEHFDLERSIVRKGAEGSDERFRLMSLVGDLELEELKFDGNNFILIGMMSTKIGNKKVKLKSPMIGATDEFEYYDNVKELLESCFAMVKKYAMGDISQNSEQFVLDFYEHKGMSRDESEELLSGMGEQEKKDFMREALEKMGMIVLDNLSEVLDGVEEEGVVDVEFKDEEKDDEVVVAVVEEEDDFFSMDKSKIVKLKRVG